ncbi:multicopper oxidase-domain-containing protein, partial [Endogone sp. FLAS-F59071]
LFPGPLVEANTGDRIIVKVTNNLVNGSSIHWHGMFQNGTTGVTQCPIPPGQTFTYNFTVPNQWGSYWWHAHTSSQYVDGIVVYLIPTFLTPLQPCIGPLIIHSPSEPMTEDYDNDIIMMISDWYHTDSGSLLSWYLSTASQGVEPVPDNGLINGMNSFNCLTDSSALFPTGNECISNAPQATFNFKAGSKYRIRIINT